MKNKFTKLLSIIIASVLGLGLFSLAPNTYAINDVCSSNAPQSVRDAAGCEGTSDQLPRLIVNILNAIIAISGIVALIFVIIGGFNYMTSAGDSGKVEKAKKTILYACIGIAVCALSFAIVNWAILGPLGNGGDNTPSYSNKNDCESAGYSWNTSSNTCDN